MQEKKEEQKKKADTGGQHAARPNSRSSASPGPSWRRHDDVTRWRSCCGGDANAGGDARQTRTWFWRCGTRLDVGSPNLAAPPPVSRRRAVGDAKRGGARRSLAAAIPSRPRRPGTRSPARRKRQRRRRAPWDWI